MPRNNISSKYLCQILKMIEDLIEKKSDVPIDIFFRMIPNEITDWWFDNKRRDKCKGEK